jgi:hypothetical protein
MKCLDEDASGRAYKYLLHGRWFDRQLVTVKKLLVSNRYYAGFRLTRDLRRESPDPADRGR